MCGPSRGRSVAPPGLIRGKRGDEWPLPGPMAHAMGYILSPLRGSSSPYLTVLVGSNQSAGRARRVYASPLRQRQPRVGQIQPVHDLVVAVPRRCVLVPRERVAVGPLEIDHPPPRLVEEGVVAGVVKRVVVVGN